LVASLAWFDRDILAQSLAHQPKLALAVLIHFKGTPFAQVAFTDSLKDGMPLTDQTARNLGTGFAQALWLSHLW
jgi:hypothetical protein